MLEKYFFLTKKKFLKSYCFLHFRSDLKQDPDLDPYQNETDPKHWKKKQSICLFKCSFNEIVPLSHCYWFKSNSISFSLHIFFKNKELPRLLNLSHLFFQYLIAFFPMFWLFPFFPLSLLCRISSLLFKKHI